MDITIITPTRNRAAQFRHLEEYMARQTVPWKRWLVVNDGDEVYQYHHGQEVVLRSPQADPEDVHSLCLNLLAGLELASGEKKFVIVEDDDWYSPDYLATMSDLLDTADLVGSAPGIYYQIPRRAVARWWNKDHAALAQTGFTAAVVPCVQGVCLRGSPFVDQGLWNAWGGSRRLVPNTEDRPLHVGLKDGTGVGMGHLLSRPVDPDGSVLRKLIGVDAERYLLQDEIPSVPGVPASTPPTPSVTGDCN